MNLRGDQMTMQPYTALLNQLGKDEIKNIPVVTLRNNVHHVLSAYIEEFHSLTSDLNVSSTKLLIGNVTLISLTINFHKLVFL